MAGAVGDGCDLADADGAAGHVQPLFLDDNRGDLWDLVGLEQAQRAVFCGWPAVLAQNAGLMA